MLERDALALRYVASIMALEDAREAIPEIYSDLVDKSLALSRELRTAYGKVP